MDKVNDFSDLFIKNCNYEVCSDDDDDDVFSNNGTETVRFCKAVDSKSKGDFVICKIFDPTTLFEDKEDSDIKQNQRWYRQLLLIREALILHEIHHPTIVDFIGLDLYNNSIHFDEDGDEHPNPIIFLEYLENKSIQTHITKKKLDLPAVKREICILGISAAIRFIHDRKIIHRGLNPNTIWLDNNFYPKIFDFSTSRSVNIEIEKPKTIIYENSIFYKAPELFEPDNRHYGEEIDIFSLARLIYLLITNYEPFNLKTDSNYNLSSFNLQQKIMNDGITPKFTKHVPKELQELLLRCWNTNPNDRPTAAEICNFVFNNKGKNVYGIQPEELEEVDKYVESIQTFEQQNSLNNDIFQFRLQF